MIESIDVKEQEIFELSMPLLETLLKDRTTGKNIVWATDDYKYLGENFMTNSEAWDYAVGMIKLDGLEPTPEFMEYIEKEKRGEATMEDLKQFLNRKYKVKSA